MSVLKSIFRAFTATISYINTYFKTFVFLFIVFFLFLPSPDVKLSEPNLQSIVLKNEILDIKNVFAEIKKASKDENIKGVLLIIDSPGGAFAPSMELALAIEELNAKKPVVAYASGTMASGSYLAGSSAHVIIANPASFIGSIGVIIQGADLSELAHKIGIKDQTITAGEFKELGTFTRAWNEQEKEFLQDLVTKSYALFTGFVANKRGLKLEERDKWANARIFLAHEAKELGLVDDVGGISKAQDRLFELSGVSEPVWAEASKFDKLLEKLGTSANSFASELAKNLLLHSSGIEAR